MFYDFIYLAQGFRMKPKIWSTLNLLRDFFSAMAESWKNLKDTIALFYRFLCVRIEIDQL